MSASEEQRILTGSLSDKLDRNRANVDHCPYQSSANAGLCRKIVPSMEDTLE